MIGLFGKAGSQKGKESAMGKILRQFLLLCLPLALLLSFFCLTIFFLPAQYDETFLGALRDKAALLASPGDKPRIIVVGGSAAAFGQRSDLIQAELPDYDVVNLGLYAGLGTTAMMDIARSGVRSGDVVVLSPEQNQQTLSGFFGAKAMWQAADGAFFLLHPLSAQRKMAMLGEAMDFAAGKFLLWQSGQRAAGEGVYRWDHFSAWGDVLPEGRDQNVMPGGYDPDMPIRFDPSLLDRDFIGEMNAFAQACGQKGALVFYRFCPMNDRAVSPAQRERIGAYEDTLRAALTFPLLGRAQESILDNGLFFDTNFHLNAEGVLVNTLRMAAQLKQALGRETEAAEQPLTLAVADEREKPVLRHTSRLFFWEERDGEAYLTGLTEKGREQNAITVPNPLEGLPVTAFSREVFAGNTRIQEITLPDSLRRIENGSFENCSSLARLILTQEKPSRLSVGSELLKGVSCTVYVPASAYARYLTDYFWSVHASRIKPLETPVPASPSPVPAESTPAPAHALFVDANGGEPLDGGEIRRAFPLDKRQLRTNTPLGQQMFSRPGFVPLCWNTRPDGAGEDIPFGSRVTARAGDVLYLRWLPATPEESLIWEERDGCARITGCREEMTTLAVPDHLGGCPVTAIAADAFSDFPVETAVLPATLTSIEPGAFSGSALRTLWLYDSLQEVSDACFAGCENLATLYIGAATPPRYAVSYFAAFADKVDWLRQNRDAAKLVMAGGSASRYAYNSVLMKRELPEYVPVNMGVYAYTNMLPQYRIMQQFMGAGDVLLSAPEFDTTATQFCITNALDALFWAMAEADYANAALLNLRQYSRVFDSFSDYLNARRDMPALRSLDTPRDFDDDDNRILYDTYNEFGDYTLSRPGAPEDVLLQHFRADYRMEAFPESMVEALNRVFGEFGDLGVTVLFAYAPRNQSSLTAESIPAARRALHQYLTEKLRVPVIIDIEESLYPGTLFYLIDSHLCDEGVYRHTSLMIQALKNMLRSQERE